MTNPPPPKSLPTTGSGRPADRRPDHGTSGGMDEDGRQAVLSARRSDPHPTGQARRGKYASEDPTPEQPGIRIYAPPIYRSHDDRARWWLRCAEPPTAAYACRCGLTDSARGEHAVKALITDYETHKATCTGPHAAPSEGRTAA
ncbi:hypothetical protein HMPREF1486_04979 [Streptomyces sp. HPH0547]|uniref:hypothetical protein n=1 Tax=Streptomyces sp. HPH0547 TaxID=1203592 RepID=UPI00034EB16D|nr:hypothetical protein [Streptomyces sp. HPH0547]EPD91411.1 hypothetical protein HMPREF1486_04979 [Streptomyces sp. HPH0547]